MKMQWKYNRTVSGVCEILYQNNNINNNQYTLKEMDIILRKIKKKIVKEKWKGQKTNKQTRNE